MPSKKKKRRLKKSVKKFLRNFALTNMTAVSVGFLLTLGSSTQIKDGNTLGVHVLKASENSEITYKKVKQTILDEMIESRSDITSDGVDFDASHVVLQNLDLNKHGIQLVNINAQVKNKSYKRTESNVISTAIKNLTKFAVVNAKEFEPSEVQNKAYFVPLQETAIVIIENDMSKAPSLQLTSNEITIDNDEMHFFNPMNYIKLINDSSGIMPVLKIDGEVDVSTDGDYCVTYQAVNIYGKSTEQTLNVHVETPQWLIDQRLEEERLAREAEEARLRAIAEAEERARLEAEAKAAAQAEQARLAAIQAQQAAQVQTYSSGTSTPQRGGGSNPYYGGWSNCTYGAWQAVYNARGISLPGWGNASNWLYAAANSGYATGSSPAVGAVAVYSNHVAYVAQVSGDQIYIIEGGFNGGYNERWVSRYSIYGQALQGYIYI